MQAGFERTPAILALEDGTIWAGSAFGAIGQRTGEVVFNTAMTGYQEVLSDPSYFLFLYKYAATDDNRDVRA